MRLTIPQSTSWDEGHFLEPVHVLVTVSLKQKLKSQITLCGSTKMFWSNTAKDWLFRYQGLETTNLAQIEQRSASPLQKRL
jgi:hypothetical protein